MKSFPALLPVFSIKLLPLASVDGTLPIISGVGCTIQISAHSSKLFKILIYLRLSFNSPKNIWRQGEDYRTADVFRLMFYIELPVTGSMKGNGI